VLDVIEREQLLAHVSAVSVAWHEALFALAKGFPQHIAAVRGRALGGGADDGGSGAVRSPPCASAACWW
jgi:4-aminobutyrate aminotransferase-like enzyme